MPTYSYACTECSNRFDVVQAFTDDSLTTCEQCNGRLRKIFGKVGVVFKGSGFYRTDNRDSGKSSSAGANAAGSTSSSDSSGGSGDGGTKSSADSGTKSGDGAKAASSSTSAPAAASA